MKTIKQFINHPLFKDYFIREAGVFAPETECYRFAVPNHDDMEVSVIRSYMTYGGDEGLFELDILEDVQRIYGGI